MFVSPVGLIGVYTSFSRESVLDLISIQKIAIENGVKAVGISDPNYSFWIEEVLTLPKTSVIFFPAIKTFVPFENRRIKLYIWPRSLSSFEYISKKEVLNLKDLRYFDNVAFYGGNDKRIFFQLYDILLGKLGIAITNHNKELALDVLDKVDYVIPFKYSTIPKELEEYSSVLKKFIKSPSPFPSASTLVREIEGLPDKLISKLSYTIEKLIDVRDCFTNDSKEDKFSDLLWSKIVSSTKPDDKVRKEFIRIRDLGLSGFFYNLINSFESFVRYGSFLSDVLSTSFIFERLNLIKINKFKKVSLFHLLFSKPFYVDILVSSKEKFKEVLSSNFGDSIFHRVYPVHLRKNLIRYVVKNIPEKKRSLLESYLENVVSTFRVSKKFFYSSSVLCKSVKRKDGILLKFCGKSYDVVLEVSHLDYLPSRSIYPKVIEVIKSERSFITPYTVSAFWDAVRNKYSISGITDALKFFYISKVLSLKPYYKSLIEEMVSNNLPLFVENIFGMDEDTIEVILEIVWSKDKKDVAINEVDLFRMLVDRNIDKSLAERITKFILRYKNVIGIRSIEVPKFYSFLSYAGLSIEDKKKFILHLLRDSVVRKKRYPFIVLQKLIRDGYDINIDINNSSLLKVSEHNKKFFLPFICGKFNFRVLESVVRERKLGMFRSFSDFYARIGKNFPRDSNKLIKVGAFDSVADRISILGIPDLLPLQKELIVIKEEFKNLGFSLYLLKKVNFDDLRAKNKCFSIGDCIGGEGNRVFGFVSGIDRYGNLFLQDEKNVIFVKNRTFFNLNVGDYGVFELDVYDGFFGKNFFLRNFSKDVWG